MKPWVPADVLDDLASGIAECGYFGSLPCQSADIIPDEKMLLVPYATSELIIALDRENSLCSKESLSFDDIKGLTALISGGQKSASSLYRVKRIFEHFNATPRIEERYSESVEDYLMSPIGKDGVILLDSLWKDFSVIQVNTATVTRSLDPNVQLVNYMAFKNDPSNEALALFADFVHNAFLEEHPNLAR